MKSTGESAPTDPEKTDIKKPDTEKDTMPDTPEPEASTEPATTPDSAEKSSSGSTSSAGGSSAERSSVPVDEPPRNPVARWIPRTVKGRVLSGIALVLLIALVGGGVYWYQNTHLPEGVAFRVYGQDVTVRELDEQVQTARALYGIQPPTEGPRLDVFRRDFAKAIAVSMAIEKAAADRNVTVADRQVSDVLARFITQFYGEGPAGHDRFVQALAEQGTSEAKVLAELKRQMVLRQLSQQVTSDVTVSDEEVRKAFDERRDQLAIPERRKIHNIVVRDKEEADRIVAELNAGANFEQLARERSADGSTKEQGGNLGLLSARQLQRPYADVAFSAPIGSVFGPVQTQYGFNVGKVVQSLPPEPAQFDKIADQLRQQLIKEKALAKWNDFLSGVIKDADVLYAEEYRPADPDALPGAEQPAPPAGPVPGQAPPAGPAPGQAPPAGPVPGQAPPAGPAPGQAPPAAPAAPAPNQVPPR